VSTIRKKELLNSNTSSTFSHNMANFSPVTAEIGSDVWGTQANFNGFRVSRPAFVTAATSLTEGQPNCMMFGRLLGWYTIYTFPGALALDGILPGAIFTLSPSLAFCHIGNVTARHSSSCGRQPNFAAWYKQWSYGTFAEATPIFSWAAITLGIVPHSGFNNV